MADMTICGNKDCPAAGRCLRATAAPGFWQSYAYWYPRLSEKFQCDGYISNNKKENDENRK